MVKFQKKYFHYLFILLITVLLGLYSYSNNLHLIESLPISYYDEYYWTTGSYYFDLLIRSDLKHPAWSADEMFISPHFAHYYYGFLIYIRYFFKDLFVDKPPYISFLIENGLCDKKDSYILYEMSIRQIKHCPYELKTDMIGGRSYYMKELGDYGKKFVELIYYLRHANSIVLTIFVMLFFIVLVRLTNNMSLSLLLPFLLSSNKLILQNTLTVYSELIYICAYLVGTYSLICLIDIKNSPFLKKKPPRYYLYLFIFCLSSSIALSTKLTGIILLVQFSIIYIYYLIKSQRSTLFIFLLTEILIVLLSINIVFNIINISPKGSSPFYSLTKFYSYRKNSLHDQLVEYPEDKLNNGIHRLKKVFDNFYFSGGTTYHNQYIFFNFDTTKYPLIQKVNFFLFLVGLYSTYLKKRSVLYLFIILLSIMLIYLALDWGRYYIQLVPYFIFFQVSGLLSLAHIVNYYLKIYSDRAFKAAK